MQSGRGAKPKSTPTFDKAPPIAVLSLFKLLAARTAESAAGLLNFT